MDIDLELYRCEITVSTRPRVDLSAIDIAPAAAQKTLVLLHGFGGQATQWRYQIQHFALTQRVIALDLRGHGRSDKPGGAYTLPEIVQDVEVALKELNAPSQFRLAGHSFGGALATEYALAHPERIEQLILIATAGEFRLNRLSRTIFRLPMPALLLLQRFTRGWLHAPLYVLKPWHQNTLAQWKGWDKFRGLSVPTLVIRGHLDFLFERPMFEQVSKTIAGAEDVDVGASGHLVMLERHDAVNRAMARVIEGESTRSWRDLDHGYQSAAQTELIHTRPWLAHYSPNVPSTIAVPDVSLTGLFQSAARRFARQVAVQYGDLQLTYQQLDEQCNRFANALRGLGVDKGERVMLALPDCPQFMIAFYGALKAGATVVLAPPQAESGEFVHQLQETSAKVLLTVYELSEKLAQARAQTLLQHVIFTDSEELRTPNRQRVPIAAQAVGTHYFSPLLNHQSAAQPDVAIDAAELALIQYTSGTTGTSKGVMLSHRNLVANTLQTRHWLPEAKVGQERFLCSLSFSHIYGLTTTLNLPIALGATLIIEPGFNIVHVLNAIKRHRPTIFPGVPGMYVAINNFPGVRQFGIDSIKYCLSGSAPLPVEVQEEFEKLTKGRLVEGYGLTEAAPVTHANPLTGGRRKVGSIGIPLPSTEARILDLIDGTTATPVGQIGELAVRGPQVMLGYWQQAAETAQVLTADGWLRTGDVAQMDAEGFFRIIARKVEMWYPNRPGEPPAFQRDVEEVLYEVPQVKEVAVVAIANQPIAFVTADADHPPADALISYCQRRLPPSLVPRQLIFVDDFPRSFIGKILRKELVKRFTELHTLDLG